MLTETSNEFGSNEIKLQSLVNTEKRNPLRPNDFVTRVRGLRRRSGQYSLDRKTPRWGINKGIVVPFRSPVP